MSLRQVRNSMPTGVEPLHSFQPNHRTSVCSMGIPPASKLRYEVTSSSDRIAKYFRTRNNRVPTTTLSWETFDTWSQAWTRNESSPRTQTSSFDRCKTLRERTRRKCSSPIHFGTLPNSHIDRSSTSGSGGGSGNDSSYLPLPSHSR